MMTYVHLFIIGTFIRTCLAITYELNTSQPIGRTLNIRGISLAPFPVRTQNNKTVDMVIALQQQSLYITNAINYNPDIRYICNCVILRVNWVQDGIFVVTNRMVMLISPYNFRNITIMNTDQNIIYAQYGSQLNVNYIAISFNNRIQLFQNTVSIYNFTTKSPCKVLTFDVLTSYLHFYDDNLHHTLFIQTLNLTSTPISIGVTVSIIPEAQYRVLSLTANGYLSEWNQSYLVFQKLLDSSLSKSTRMFLFLTTGFEFLAIYAQEGLAGSLKLWQYESNQNVLLNFHKNIAFKQGIKSISSQNNKIAILNDDNEYKILSRVQSGASGMNIWWIILPSSALVLILVIVVIIKIKMRAKKPNKESKYENLSAVKEKEKEKEKKIEKEVKKYQQEEKIVEKKKGLSKLEQKLIKEGGEGGELEEQRIYNIENIYANVSAIEVRGEQNESKTKTKKKYRLKQKDEEKDTKGKQTKSKYTNYYQFNSQIDEYTKVDRAPQ